MYFIRVLIVDRFGFVDACSVKKKLNIKKFSQSACRPVNKIQNSLVDDKFAKRRQCLMLKSVRSLIRSNNEVDDSEGIKNYANSLRAVCAQKSLCLSFTMEEK